MHGAGPLLCEVAGVLVAPVVALAGAVRVIVVVAVRVVLEPVPVSAALPELVEPAVPHAASISAQATMTGTTALRRARAAAARASGGEVRSVMATVWPITGRLRAIGLSP